MFTRVIEFFWLINAALAIVIPLSPNKVGRIKSDTTSVQKRSHLQFNLDFVQDTYYSTTLEIGTPPQKVTVLFDTGSADTWLMDSGNVFCKATYEKCISEDSCNLKYNNAEITSDQLIDCDGLDQFNDGESSSFSQVGDSRFYIEYADKSFADGIWAKETFKFGDMEIENVQFGLADFATTAIGGVLGIGFERRESVKNYDNAPNKYYANFPQILKSEGIIDSVAYSLCLDDTSSILFGAFDQNKVDGELVTFPMINMYPSVVDKPSTLSLTIQGISFKDEKSCEFDSIMTTKYPTLIDSGSTFMFFPQTIADKLASYVNATWSDNDGIYLMECLSDNSVLNEKNFVFDFGDIQIEMPLSDLFLSPDDNSNTCGFAIQRGENEITLGDVFLNRAYVIFDLDHYQITLGKLNKNSESSNIINIPSDGVIAKTAKAKAWSTYEPFTVSSDIFFKEKKSCQAQTKTSTTIPITTMSTEKVEPTKLQENIRRVTTVTTIVKHSTVKLCGSKTLG